MYYIMKSATYIFSYLSIHKMFQRDIYELLYYILYYILFYCRIQKYIQ